MENVRHYLHVMAEIMSAFLISIAIGLACATVAAYVTETLAGAMLGAAAGVVFAVSCLAYAGWRMHMSQTASDHIARRV